MSSGLLEQNIEYSGKQFNLLHTLPHKEKETKFYMFLDNDFKHNGIKYKYGLNVDLAMYDYKLRRFVTNSLTMNLIVIYTNLITLN